MEGDKPGLIAGAAAGAARHVEEPWALTASRMLVHSMATVCGVAAGVAWKELRMKAPFLALAPAILLEDLSWATGNVVVGVGLHGVIESAAPGSIDTGSGEA